MAPDVSLAGLAQLLGGLLAAFLQLGELLLVLLLGDHAVTPGAVAFRFHGMHLVGAAGAELGEGRAREVLVRLQLREAIRLHVAVVDDQVLAGGGRACAHLAKRGASSDPLGIHLRGSGGFGVAGGASSGIAADLLHLIRRELLLPASGEQGGRGDDSRKRSQGLQRFVHEFLLV